jgi:uncharacterized membrane protein
MVDIGIFLAAAGITILEMAEAAAVGLALYASSHKGDAFLFVILGVVVVLAPTVAVGKLISLLPVTPVRLFAATLLLYFGLRLTRSARRAVLRSRAPGSSSHHEEEGKGLFLTGFSVGAIEAFEAAIVLVALIPINYDSALSGLSLGFAVVIVATLALKSQVRRIKQASMKIPVAALLLSFSVFWYAESVPGLAFSDLVLLPIFLVFVLAVYMFANRHSENERLPQEALLKGTAPSS